MDNFIRDILKQVHPDTEIDADALAQVRTILESIIASKQNMNLEQWISTFPGELANHARSEANKAKPSDSTRIIFPNFTPQEAAAIEYILAEILELAGNKARDRSREEDEAFGRYAQTSRDYRNREPDVITLYDVLSAIYNDEELMVMLKNYIKLFPFGFAKRYSKFQISKSILEDELSFSDQMSEEYKLGLLDVLTALVNYYADNFPLNALWDYQLKVANLIVPSVNPNRTLNTKDLINAVYNNPQISNIPWRDVFTKALEPQNED